MRGRCPPAGGRNRRSSRTNIGPGIKKGKKESNWKSSKKEELPRLISHRKVGGVPRSWAAGSSHHDRLKGKSHRDIGSNPIHDSG
jgi:hypothetical protein